MLFKIGIQPYNKNTESGVPGGSKVGQGKRHSSNRCRERSAPNNPLIISTYRYFKNEKAGKSFDFPAVVDQTLRISNLSFLEGLLQIQTFIDGFDR